MSKQDKRIFKGWKGILYMNIPYLDIRIFSGGMFISYVNQCSDVAGVLRIWSQIRSLRIIYRFRFELPLCYQSLSLENESFVHKLSQQIEVKLDLGIVNLDVT